MKNRYLAGVALAAMSLFSVQVAGAQDVYVNVFAGASLPGDWTFDEITPFFPVHDIISLNTGYVFGGAVGVGITDAMRAEIELSHAQWKSADSFYSSGEGGHHLPADGSVNATYVMANGWFDLKNDSAFTPYIGGGVGAAWLNGDVGFFGQDNGFGPSNRAALAYQLGAGVKFDVNEKVALDVAYRYKSIVGGKNDNLNATYSGFENADLNTHNIQVGLTYKF